jgi:hypothetical protein
VDIFQNYLDDTVRYYKDVTNMLQTQMSGHDKQLKDLQKDNAALRKQLETVYASPSWQVTKPLRVAGRLMKRTTKKGEK